MKTRNIYTQSCEFLEMLTHDQNQIVNSNSYFTKCFPEGEEYSKYGKVNSKWIKID
jgi:hypothetical protein